MNYDILYMIAEIPIPVIILLVSALIWKDPPRMNENFGYRTKRSLKNEETWNTAQTLYGKYCTIIFSIVLSATVAADIALLFVRLNEDARMAAFLITVTVQVAALITVIVMVERKLNILFDNDGKPKDIR